MCLHGDFGWGIISKAPVVLGWKTLAPRRDFLFLFTNIQAGLPCGQFLIVNTWGSVMLSFVCAFAYEDQSSLCWFSERAIYKYTVV